MIAMSGNSLNNIELMKQMSFLMKDVKVYKEAAKIQVRTLGTLNG